MIILASSSPRRKELLHKLIDNFRIEPNDALEIKNGNTPCNVVMENAKAKAMACDKKRIVISADTVVYMDGEFFLKPKDTNDAFCMLKKLRGRIHMVYTGVCVRKGEKCVTFYDKSAVELKNLTDNQIKDYINTKHPLDKAGAYGIQDNSVTQSYDGSYSNIMGLPIEKLRPVLVDFGVDCKVED